MYQTAVSKTATQEYEVGFIRITHRQENLRCLFASAFCAFYHLCFILSKAF